MLKEKFFCIVISMAIRERKTHSFMDAVIKIMSKKEESKMLRCVWYLLCAAKKMAYSNSKIADSVWKGIRNQQQEWWYSKNLIFRIHSHWSVPFMQSKTTHWQRSANNWTNWRLKNTTVWAILLSKSWITIFQASNISCSFWVAKFLMSSTMNSSNSFLLIFSKERKKKERNLKKVDLVNNKKAAKIE